MGVAKRAVPASPPYINRKRSFRNHAPWGQGKAGSSSKDAIYGWKREGVSETTPYMGVSPYMGLYRWRKGGDLVNIPYMGGT